MFTELAEEYQPQNIRFPAIRIVNREEWLGLTNNWNTAPTGYFAHHYFGHSLLYAFADARHVEFIDLYTRKPCLPPEMFLVKVFKGMAKSRGPFVVSLQHAFRQPMMSWPYSPCSPRKTQSHTKRMLSTFGLVYGEGFGHVYPWTNSFTARTAKHLGVRKWDDSVGLLGTHTGLYLASRNPGMPVLLTNNEEYIIYKREGQHENE
jgi:hypothetical protein